MKTLANTNTAAGSDEFVKDYLHNYLAAQKNENLIGKLDSEVVVIKAQDSNKDIGTNFLYLYLVTIVSLKLPTYLQH